MSPVNKNNGSINIADLDRDLIRGFYAKAGRGDKEDKFIYSWIVINHYYTAIADENPDPAWGGRRPTERQEARNLGRVLSSVWQKRLVPTQVFGTYSITLPLMSRGGGNVPANVPAGSRKANQLSPEDCMDVLYQLRCDLCHGVRTLRAQTSHHIDFACTAAYALAGVLFSETTPK